MAQASTDNKCYGGVCDYMSGLCSKHLEEAMEEAHQMQTVPDNEVVIRTWVETDRSSHGSIEYCYEYKLPSGKRTSGTFLKGESLDILAQNLRGSGYEPRLEKGRYEQVWVPEKE